MNLIFIGPPGAGKGTQAQLIEEEFSFIQVSTGDILRSAVEEGTTLGLSANSFMEKGSLVPDDLVVEIIKDRIKKPDYLNGFILDGFPRTLQQAKALDPILSTNNMKIDYVLNFEVEEEKLIKRLIDRNHKEDRSDDNLDTIKNRLKVFKENTKPLIDYYSKKQKIIMINGNGSIKEINQRVKAAIGV